MTYTVRQAVIGENVVVINLLAADWKAAYSPPDATDDAVGFGNEILLDDPDLEKDEMRSYVVLTTTLETMDAVIGTPATLESGTLLL